MSRLDKISETLKICPVKLHSMNVLLVEPDYYSKYPPLGLMKLASYHRSRGDKIKLIRGINKNLNFNPDKILITSLFTYAWAPVHKAIEFYHLLYPESEMEIGGIYASMMQNRLSSFYPFSKVHVGLFEPAEQYMPAYDLLKDIEKWEKWDASILFTSRGCIRKCPFCIVPKLEGKIRSNISDVQSHVYPGHKRIILWDNNFFDSPRWKDALIELKDIGLKIDFNQGLDARLINEETVQFLSELNVPIFRMAYDLKEERNNIIKSFDLFSDYGIRKRNIFIYTLYNFYIEQSLLSDTPEDFLQKIRDILELGCVAYPMRYEPNDSLKKNQFISRLWSAEQLEAVADARRVIGYGGAFPPYEGLIKKLSNAKGFNDAFSLYPPKNNPRQFDAISSVGSLPKSPINSSLQS